MANTPWSSPVTWDNPGTWDGTPEATEAPDATWGDAATTWGSAEVSWAGGTPVLVAEPSESVQYVSYGGEWVPFALTPAVVEEAKAEFEAGTPTKAVFTLYNADESPAANASARVEVAYPTFTEWQDVASNADGQAVYDAATWAAGMPHYIRLHSIDGTVVTDWQGPFGPQDPTVSIASVAELSGYIVAGTSGELIWAYYVYAAATDFHTYADGLYYYYYGMSPESAVPPPPALAPGWSGEVIQIIRNTAAGDTLTALYYGSSSTAAAQVGNVIDWTTVQSWSAPDLTAFDGTEIYIIAGTTPVPTADRIYVIQSVPFGTLPPADSVVAAELAWGFRNLVFTPPA